MHTISGVTIQPVQTDLFATPAVLPPGYNLRETFIQTKELMLREVLRA